MSVTLGDAPIRSVEEGFVRQGSDEQVRYRINLEGLGDVREVGDFTVLDAGGGVHNVTDGVSEGVGYFEEGVFITPVLKNLVWPHLYLVRTLFRTNNMPGQVEHTFKVFAKQGKLS